MPRANTGPHLWRDPRSGIWHIRLFKAGRARSRSTGHRDPELAGKALAALLLKQGAPALPPEPTIADAIAGFLAASHDKLSYRQIVGHTRPLVAAMGWLKIATLKQPHIRSYIKRRLETPRKPRHRGSKASGTISVGTVREELSKLRAALRWAHEEGLCPRVQFTIPLTPEPRSRWLTREEADKLVAGAVGPHVRLALVLLLHTAGRPSAVLDLTWDRVDFERAQVDLGEKRGGKRRAIVAMNGTLRAALVEARQNATTPYVIEYGGKRVHRLEKGWRTALRRSGLEHCTPHDLRRTAATRMLLNGIPIEQVSRFLGHKNSAVTAKVYARHTTEWLQNAAEALER